MSRWCHKTHGGISIEEVVVWKLVFPHWYANVCSTYLKNHIRSPVLWGDKWCLSRVNSFTRSPSESARVSQGHCQRPNLRRQFTCLLVWIQSDEGGRLRLCASVSAWWENADEGERWSGTEHGFVSEVRTGIQMCPSACEWICIVGKSTKVRALLPCISDELSRHRQRLVFTQQEHRGAWKKEQASFPSGASFKFDYRHTT